MPGACRLSWVSKGIPLPVRLVIATLTSGGTQNFLGAPWVEPLLRVVPARKREEAALFLLSLSPHYFYADRHVEAERNRISREVLVRDLLLEHLDSSMTVLDLGCGPGYMAAAVALQVHAVEAVDVSEGVLACARILNGAHNITYETPAQAIGRPDQVDLVYSFAVVQHLSDAALREVLGLLRKRLRPSGKLLIHFAKPTNGWRTEDKWRSDSTLKARVRLRFGLNCFGRSESSVCDLVSESGFTDPQVMPLTDKTASDDDIASQHLLIAVG